MKQYRVGLIGKLPHHAFVESPRLGVAKLAMTAGHSHQRLGGDGAIGRRRQRAVLRDRAAQVALDRLGLNRRAQRDLRAGLGRRARAPRAALARLVAAEDVGMPDKQRHGEDQLGDNEVLHRIQPRPCSTDPPPPARVA